MNSPFEIFRRNLKPLMVFLTGLALFAFVVLPVMDSAMRQNAGTVADGVVASYDGTNLTRARVDYFTQNHQSTIRFLYELAELTLSRGGQPRTAGFQYDGANNQIRSIGINQDPSFDSTIRTFMLASEAQKLGFDLDDNSLQVWMESFTDGLISNSDIDAMLMQSTSNRMGRPHLYEQLRNHLLANVYLTRGYSGLFMGEGPLSGPLMTPQEQWANFLKLNQNAVVSAYGVMVNDYLDRTNKAPSAAEVEEMYEEGKTRYANDQSPEPGFRRRYSARFEYLAGNFEKFLEEEVAKLSEEEIRAEYERRLQGGDFRLPESATSPAETTTPESGEQDPAADPAETAESESESESAESESTGAAESDATENEPAAEESPESSSESSEETNANEPDSESSEPATTSEPEAEAEPDPQPEQSDQSNAVTRAIQLVSAQENTQEESSETEPEPQAETEAATEDTEPQAEPQAETEAAAEETEPAAQNDDTEPAPETTPADQTDATESTEAEESAPESESDEETKVETFEDVRQRIAEEMATPAAAERLNEALTLAMTEMRLYFNKLAIHESDVSIGQAGKPPEKPKLKEIAEQYGLEHETIGPYDAVNIQDEPISNSSELGTQFSGPGPSFPIMMYGFDNGQMQVPQQQLFAPIRTTDAAAAKQYVSWKIDETEAYIPSLEEVRDEVVMAIRTQEARKYAQEAAEELAKQASDKALADVVPADRMDQIKEGLGPFTWMKSFGFQGATIGNVDELDNVGEDFMKAVFTSGVNDVVVGPNQTKSIYYVVKPTRFEPALEELRRQFKQPTNRMMAMLLGNGGSEIITDFYKGVDEEAGFVNYTEEEE